VRRVATKPGKAAGPYCPDAGDIVWLDFSPTLGHEQNGRRPALVLSPRVYNEARRMCLACPITSRIRDWPFEVVLPEGCDIRGAVIADQIRNLSWTERGATFACKAGDAVLADVRARLKSVAGIA